MSNESLAHNLLRESERLLSEELADKLSGKERFTAKMIARALSVALRDLESGAQAESAAQATLAGLLGDKAPRGDVPDNEAGARFVAAMREGRFDADEQAYEALLKIAEARVAISNPTALEG